LDLWIFMDYCGMAQLTCAKLWAMLWDIDLIFGMWVYNDKLQIKFTFRSSPMIFGQVMVLKSISQIIVE
jgi:hypothetical protein